MFRVQSQPNQRSSSAGRYPRAVFDRPNNTEPNSGTAQNTFTEASLTDKANNIFRAVFPCNKSSSKQLIVAMEPGMNFAPSVTLSKPGTRGIKIPRKAFVELMQNREKLTRFFKSEKFEPNTPNTVIPLDAFVNVVLPGTATKHKIATLVCKTEFAPRCEVSFKETTWEHIVELEPVVSHLLAVYAGYAPLVLNLFRDIVHCVALEVVYVRGREKNDVVAHIKTVLNKIDSDAQPSKLFDSVRAVEEIKLFCIDSIMEEINETDPE